MTFIYLAQLIMQDNIFLEVCYLCEQNRVQPHARPSFYFSSSISISFAWEKSKETWFYLALWLSWLPGEKKCYRLPWQPYFPRAPCCTSFALKRNNHYYSVQALIKLFFFLMVCNTSWSPPFTKWYGSLRENPLSFPKRMLSLPSVHQAHEAHTYLLGLFRDFYTK